MSIGFHLFRTPFKIDIVSTWLRLYSDVIASYTRFYIAFSSASLRFKRDANSTALSLHYVFTSTSISLQSHYSHLLALMRTILFHLESLPHHFVVHSISLRFHFDVIPIRRRSTGDALLPTSERNILCVQIESDEAMDVFGSQPHVATKPHANKSDTRFSSGPSPTSDIHIHKHIHVHIHTHLTYTYTYTYMYIRTCMYRLCVFSKVPRDNTKSSSTASRSKHDCAEHALKPLILATKRQRRDTKKYSNNKSEFSCTNQRIYYMFCA